MKWLRKQQRAARARVRAAKRTTARVALMVVVITWLLTTYTREVLALVVCVAFAIALAGAIKLAHAGRARELAAPVRAVGQAVRTRGGARGGAVVTDEHGKRQFCYALGGFSFWNPDHLEAIKVGHSNAPRLRVGQFQGEERGLEWRLLSFCDGGEPLERGLHARLDEHRLPRSELFIPHADVLEVVRELAESDGGEITAAGSWVLEHIDPEQYRTIRRGVDR